MLSRQKALQKSKKQRTPISWNYLRGLLTGMTRWAQNGRQHSGASVTDRVGKSSADHTGSASAGRLRVAARDGERVGTREAASLDNPAPGPLAPHASLDDALAAVLSDCLRQFTTHAIELRKGYNTAAVHQARVALRRLRAFLGLIKTIVSCAERATLAVRAKEVAGALGAARDWDVFCERLEREVREIAEAEPRVYAALDAAEQRRIQAQQSARTMIARPATLAFETSLGDFIAGRGWLNGAEGLAEQGTARDFATQALHRLHQRAAKRCANLVDASPEEMHEARIAVKKLRYAAELFRDLFSAKRARAYLRDLAKTQERLGLANDVETGERLWDAIVAENDSTRDVGAVELLRRKKRREDQKIIRAARNCGLRIGRLKPFWA